MGDRANIRVITEEKSPAIYFYTHWRGYKVPAIIQTALQRRERWTDGSYLARIIFCELVPLDEWHEANGFGIDIRIGDNEYPLLTINIPKQIVEFNSVKFSFDDVLQVQNPSTKKWTFDQFCELKPSKNQLSWDDI